MRSLAVTAEIAAEVVPEALRPPDLSAGLMHHGSDHPGLRLALHAEPTGDDRFSSFDLILNTGATEDGLTCAGDHSLSVLDGETGEAVERTGKVTCGSEWPGQEQAVIDSADAAGLGWPELRRRRWTC